MVDLPTEAEPVKVIEGDCLDVLPFLLGAGVGAILSDPPYGMNWNTNSKRFTGGRKGHRRPGEGREDWPEIQGDNRPFDSAPWLAFPKVVLWGANHYAASLPVGTTLVWVKRSDSAYGSFLSDAEIAWQKGGHGVYLHRDQSMNANASRRFHPTQKPVGLMRWCIERLKLAPGSLILDPYAGSGATGIAAAQLGMRCILIEKEPAYAKICRKRVAEVLSVGLFADVC